MAKTTAKTKSNPAAYTGEVFTPEASGEQEVFRFRLRKTGETVHEVPLAEYLTASLVARLRRATLMLRPFIDMESQTLKKDPPSKTLEELATVQELILRSGYDRIYEDATEKEIAQIWNAWGAASGLALGES